MKYLGKQIVYGMFLYLALSPVLIGVIYLEDYMHLQVSINSAFEIFKFTLGIIYLLGVPVFARHLSWSSIDHNLDFYPAFKMAVFHVRINLSYFPVIGRIFSNLKSNDDK